MESLTIKRSEEAGSRYGRLAWHGKRESPVKSRGDV
jgi:hypothetical protein